jgi:hypothetical protein
MLRAVLLRDFRARPLAAAVLCFTTLGIAAALVAASLPAHASGSALVVLRFDRTLVAIAGVACVFRVIQHISKDAQADWTLQLMASGASRELYALFVVTSATLLYIACYAAGGLAFSVTSLLRMGSRDALLRLAASLPLVPLPLLSAALFAAALACLFEGAVAVRCAVALLVAPWVGLFISIAARGEPVSAVRWLKLLDLPVPRLYVDTGARHLSAQVAYIGIAAVLVLVRSGTRVGRLR